MFFLKFNAQLCSLGQNKLNKHCLLTLRLLAFKSLASQKKLVLHFSSAETIFSKLESLSNRFEWIFMNAALFRFFSTFSFDQFFCALVDKRNLIFCLFSSKHKSITKVLQKKKQSGKNGPIKICISMKPLNSSNVFFSV